jgi:hypothetical protein
MSEKNSSRFPPESAAHNRRDRLPCFARFFGESVSDTLGVVLAGQSANKCQDCPDADICSRLLILHRLEQLSERQKRIIERLDSLS